MADLIAYLAIALHVLVVLIATVIISANRAPSAAIAWVLVIIFLPAIGIIAFWLIGVGRLPKHRRDIQHRVNATMSKRLPEAILDDPHPDRVRSAADLNTTLGALPMVRGNNVRLLTDYEGGIRDMIRAIDQATTSVHVEFYVLVRDATTEPFFDALARAARRGVVVRVLTDHIASLMYPKRRETRDAVQRAGGRFRYMLPLRPLKGQWQRPDLRNHRKLVVVDGMIGYTGSQNLIDATYLKAKNVRRGLRWHELMMRLDGPVVAELDAVFVTDWYSETREPLPLAPVHEESLTFGRQTVEARAVDPDAVDAQVVPSGPSFENDNNRKLFVLLLHRARRRISITSPYFVPDESTLLALVTAAARGVEVELFVSEIGDQALVHHAQRSYYEALLRAGVAIYLYRSPTVLHAKHFSIDDDIAVIGSSNMDIRSFELNMEVSVLVRSESLVTRMKAVEDGYRAASRRLDAEAWFTRPLHERVFDNLARLTSSLQ